VRSSTNSPFSKRSSLELREVVLERRVADVGLVLAELDRELGLGGRDLALELDDAVLEVLDLLRDVGVVELAEDVALLDCAPSSTSDTIFAWPGISGRTRIWFAALSVPFSETVA